MVGESPSYFTINIKNILNRPILNNFRTKKKLLSPSSSGFRKKESPPSKILTATVAESYKVLSSFYITGKKLLD